MSTNTKKGPVKGKKAPAFSGPDQNGKIRSLEEFSGKKLVLYFYPKDNTPTCTVEACDLRDNYKRLKKAGYNILGVSADSAKRHQNFISKFDLPFDLLADEDQTICKAYNVWGEKSMFGKKYMGIIRTTFIINEEGIIEDIIEKVESKRHSEQILAGK